MGEGGVDKKMDCFYESQNNYSTFNLQSFPLPSMLQLSDGCRGLPLHLEPSILPVALISSSFHSLPLMMQLPSCYQLPLHQDPSIFLPFVPTSFFALPAFSVFTVSLVFSLSLTLHLLPPSNPCHRIAT